MIARRLLPPAAFLLAAAGTAAVAAVPVRSGEHATFSRLVFADAPGRSWSVERMGRRAVIAFSAGAPDLDLATVFDLIPRRRIVSAASAAGRLALDLGCDCTVEVTQIPTGHIVIDVGDPRQPLAPLRTEPALGGGVLPLVLPLRDIGLFMPGAAADDASSDLQASVLALEGPRQVRRHPAGTPPVLTPLVDGPDEPPSPPGCPFEDLARETFGADPHMALAGLPDGIASLLDGSDRPDPEGMLALATLYLAAGFGAEAAQVARSSGTDSLGVAVVAAALDGLPYPPEAAIDPACGPATAILALLGPTDATDWTRADEPAIAPFLDRLHPTTLANLLPRLERRLATIGDASILAALAPVGPPGPEDVPDQLAAAAGTDEAAVAAAVALLERTNARLEPAPEGQLVSAMALLQSVPVGVLHASLEGAIASALVMSDRPGEVAALVAGGSADAETLLHLAIDARPPEAAAEFAVRLRPHLVAGGDAARRAGALFRSFGLDAMAEQFDARVPVGPEPVEPAGPLSDPWLARDLAAMVGTDRETWTARNRMAEAILARGAATPPPMDLAAAAAALDESRRLSILVGELVAEGGPRVTGR